MGQRKIKKCGRGAPESRIDWPSWLEHRRKVAKSHTAKKIRREERQQLMKTQAGW